MTVGLREQIIEVMGREHYNILIAQGFTAAGIVASDPGDLQRFMQEHHFPTPTIMALVGFVRRYHTSDVPTTITLKQEKTTRASALRDYLADPSPENEEVLNEKVGAGRRAYVPANGGGVDLEATLAAWNHARTNGGKLPSSWRNSDGAIVNLVCLEDTHRHETVFNPLTGQPLMPFERLAELTEDELLVVAYNCLFGDHAFSSLDEDAVVEGLRMTNPTPTWNRRRNALISARPSEIQAARLLLKGQLVLPKEDSDARGSDASQDGKLRVGRTIDELRPQRNALQQLISIEDIQSICFDLGIDFESLEGNNKPTYFLSLIQHCTRTYRLPQLAEALVKRNPLKLE